MPCGKDLLQQQSFLLDLYYVLNKQDWTVTRDGSIWCAVYDATYIWNALPLGLLQCGLQAAVEESDSQARSSRAWCSFKEKSVEVLKLRSALILYLNFEVHSLCLRFCHCAYFAHWLPCAGQLPFFAVGLLVALAGVGSLASGPLLQSLAACAGKCLRLHSQPHLFFVIAWKHRTSKQVKQASSIQRKSWYQYLVGSFGMHSKAGWRISRASWRQESPYLSWVRFKKKPQSKSHGNSSKRQ